MRTGISRTLRKLNYGALAAGFFAIAGLALVTLGLGDAWRPLGLIFAGVCCVAIAFGYVRGGPE